MTFSTRILRSLFPLFVALIAAQLPETFPAYEPPAPGVTGGTDTAEVSWQGTGNLVGSHDLSSEWTDLGIVASPASLDITGFDSYFFRVEYNTFTFTPVDTNQLTAYDDTGAALDPLPEPGETFHGQDAHYTVSPPRYTDNGDGTITDHNTGLTWQQVPPSAFYSWTEALAYADSLVLGGENDWRLPTMKELLSLADFNGSSRSEIDRPYLDDSVFTIHDPLAITTFVPAGASSTKREIDGQFWSSTAYVGRTINDDSATFGYNFIDGRIKGYPNGVLSGPTGTAFVRCVRGNPAYGENNFVDNGDGTITDLATGLMWLQQDSGAFPSAGSRGDGTLDWSEALAWAENLEFAGYDDWTLPDAKQLHTIVDYTRAPDADDPEKRSAAIDPIFHLTEAESWFWSSTSLGDDLFAWGVYVCFGRALAVDQNTLLPTVNAHGAGAMRSDPKSGDPSAYSGGHGPQYDQVRIFNYARPVRRCLSPPVIPADEPGDLASVLSGPVAAPADTSVLPSSVTLGGVAVDLGTVYRPSQHEITFDFDTSDLPPGEYPLEVIFEAPAAVLTGSYTVHGNILLMIVDDWGHDASPVDNNEPGVHLANMPNLTALAAEGLRFTRAYSHPTCSPTRATILTGRQVWQHDVGDPGEARNFSTDEITLPEIFTTMNAPHAMLSVGKWHLGGNDSAYASRGGWPEFYGINGGGVSDFFSWEKNSNGTVATSSTYTTTDQVNETVAFIEAREASQTPWFAWVAFNSAHTPLHDPPAELAPSGGYSAIGAGESTESYQFRKMLESLDTEMGRLLDSINPVRTHVLLIGDNGTTGSVIQAPYGNGRAKGSIYNGGSHVPLIVKGPAVSVTPGTTSDALVHGIDLFSTILELAGVDEALVPGLSERNVTSTSIVPILRGTDTADRCVVVEKQDETPARAIILDDYPDYKLVIYGDPDSALDDPVFEFYNTGSPSFDVNEQSPLDLDALDGGALAAYQACLAKDAALGGGYSDPASVAFDTVYIELPDSGVSPPVPNLTRPNGGPLDVTSVTIDGASATVVGRFDSGSSLTDESDDQEQQYWVKARISPATGGPYSTAEVVFPDTPGGDARVYESINTILVKPSP